MELFAIILLTIICSSVADEFLPNYPIIELPPEVAKFYDNQEANPQTNEDERIFGTFLKPFFNLFNSEDSECGISSYGLDDGTDDDRIINGVYIHQYMQPWAAQVYMLIDGSIGGVCTGSLINKLYVLTAAHCLHGFTANDIVVILGNSTRAPGVLLQAVELSIHEKYIEEVEATGKIIADVAVIKLEEAVTYTKLIMPICLSDEDSSIYDYRLGTAAGWGRVSATQLSNDLKQGILLAAGSDLCSRNENYLIDIIQGHICGFTPYSSDSVCNGDSGGPFSIVKNKKTYQIGITSMVATGCPISFTNPNIFADVNYYRDWIMEKSADGRESCFIFC